MSRSASDLSRRVPIDRPCRAALSFVLARANAEHDSRPYAERPWFSFAQRWGVMGLVNDAEQGWAKARASTAATSDGDYLNTVADAIIALLQAIHMAGTLRGGATVPAPLAKAGPGLWLLGAWPVTFPAVPPKALQWPTFSMTERELLASLQNAALHLSQAMCSRMDKAGIVPPVVEVVA